jgi:hypothetical protein
MSVKSTFALRSLKSEAGLFINLKSHFKFHILFSKGFGGLGPGLINAKLEKRSRSKI